MRTEGCGSVSVGSVVVPSVPYSLFGGVPGEDGSSVEGDSVGSVFMSMPLMRVMGLGFGVQRLAFGVQRLAFSVWRLAFGVPIRSSSGLIPPASCRALRFCMPGVIEFGV